MLITVLFFLNLAGALSVAVSMFVPGVFRKSRKHPGVLFFLPAGITGLVLFIERSFQIGFPALTNTFESLILLSWAGNLSSFIMLRGRSPEKNLLAGGLHFLLLLLPALAASPLFFAEPVPPIPILQSYWLVLHVSFAFIGESLFLVAFVASLLRVITRDTEASKPGIRRLDRISYHSILAGFPVYTAGALLFGAVWAYNAWGRFWGWDPKETWALITWIIYALYLHVRLVVRADEKICAWISVAGFLVTLFTFFGVNYLLPGLHSYA